MKSGFSYAEAFSRNLGWFTEAEQQALRGKTVAIAGMGGVGGVHLLTLARLGVANFRIADLDVFETANFNRQVGAMVSTIDQPKVEVLARMAKDINPETKVAEFGKGVTEANLDEFLSGADLFIDGFDFFVISMRRKTFARCRELGIPAVTAAPIGMGAAFLYFAPDGMTFEDYFRFDDVGENGQQVKFLVGLAPSLMHTAYLVDKTRADLKNHKTPSTFIGVELCAAYTGAQAIKLLFGRGEVRPAPYHYHFDAYRNKFKACRQSGNGGWLAKLKCRLVEKEFLKQLETSGGQNLSSAGSH